MPTSGPELQSLVINLISDRTGYPVDLIEPDLDLEADLSIDSIKRAEIAGEVAARLGLASLAGESALAESRFEELVKARSVRAIIARLEEVTAAMSGAAAAGQLAGRLRELGADAKTSTIDESAADHVRAVMYGARIAASRLVKIYQMGKVEVRALNDVSLEIGEGAMVCIMGRSGSGKSTLLRQLGLIDRPTSGSVWLNGREVTGLPERRRSQLRLLTLGYVFQEYALLPELTAAENVCLPALMAGHPLRHCRRRALELLEVVELSRRAWHRPKELSGGEQQRAAIARALVNKPGTIFADEPTANLDSISARRVMQTLQKVNEVLGTTVVLVSHDPSDANYATQLIHLSDGTISGTEDRDRMVSGPQP